MKRLKEQGHKIPNLLSWLIDRFISESDIGHLRGDYEEIYDKKNNRVRQFVRPGEFVPIEKTWAALRPALREYLS